MSSKLAEKDYKWDAPGAQEERRRIMRQIYQYVEETNPQTKDQRSVESVMQGLAMLISILDVQKIHMTHVGVSLKLGSILNLAFLSLYDITGFISNVSNRRMCIVEKELSLEEKNVIREYFKLTEFAPHCYTANNNAETFTKLFEEVSTDGVARHELSGYLLGYHVSCLGNLEVVQKYAFAFYLDLHDSRYPNAHLYTFACYQFTSEMLIDIQRQVTEMTDVIRKISPMWAIHCTITLNFELETQHIRTIFSEFGTRRQI